jgi:O-succinylbenzoic acid--CoA ligase
VQYIAGKMMVARAIVGGYNLEVRKPSSRPIEAGMKGKLLPLTPFQLTNQINDLPQHEIEIFLIGGGAISPNLQAKIAEAGIKAYASFGMTETLSHFALAEIGENPTLEYRCLNGVTIKTNAMGQLSVNWPGMTQGWLETNDLVEGKGFYFKWLGRSDYLINTGGIKVIPEQIESLLYPFIDGEYFIYGLPDESLGQEVVLFTEIENDLNLLNQIAFPTPYHKPKRIVQVEDFLRTNSGKIKREATINAWLKKEN